MVQEFVKQWEQNKHKLEQYFKETSQAEYASYESIVRKIFELCITESKSYNGGFDLSKMTVIDDGHYQGTQIFIIPTDAYQPDAKDYVMTHTYYGSCSGCDTLEGILYCDIDSSKGTPSDEQAKDYMSLALHLVQKLKWLSED